MPCLFKRLSIPFTKTINNVSHCSNVLKLPGSISIETSLHPLKISSIYQGPCTESLPGYVFVKHCIETVVHIVHR